MAFTPGKTKLGKVAYDIYLKCAGTTSFNTYQQVGSCMSEPSLKETKGDTIKTNDGMDNVIAKNAEASFTVIEVTDANRLALNELINKPATIVVFVPKGGSTPTDTPASGEWRITGIQLFPEISINGNNQNTIAVSGTVEISPTANGVVSA